MKSEPHEAPEGLETNVALLGGRSGPEGAESDIESSDKVRCGAVLVLCECQGSNPK